MSDLRSLARVLLPPVLLLFVVPLLSLGIAQWGIGEVHGLFAADVRANIERDASLTPEQRGQLLTQFAEHPPASVCADSAPEFADYRAAVCAPGSELWQFFWARRASVAALGVGVAALLTGLGLAGVAHARPGLQYPSFVLGSGLLRGVAVLEVLVQGVLAVWSSFWVTALAFEVYVLKLILLVAVAAAAGMWTAIRGMFREVPPPPALEGRRIGPADAPTLWDRLRAIAAQLGTEPPAQLVAGIDDRFFVTEAPLRLGPEPLRGRTLFVSLPLLRILDKHEAEAVLSHELAHFRGGDAASSARMGPELVRFDAYLEALAGNLTTLPAFYLLRLFRVAFELALAKERRDRELRADRTAVGVTSPGALARSLLKVTAYSSYRRQIEESLFAEARAHEGALGLAERVASGLPAHASSAGFAEALGHEAIPHPFDSHPPLEERFANVGAEVSGEERAGLLQQSPAESWADGVTEGRAIEAELWAAMEARFKAAHEQSLAYRYGPDTEEERALVLRYFPGADFGGVRVSIDGVALPGGPSVPWDDVLGASVEDGTFRKSLNLSVPGTTVRVDLKALGSSAEPFKAAFGAYWHRHQVMRQLRKAR